MALYLKLSHHSSNIEFDYLILTLSIDEKPENLALDFEKYESVSDEAKVSKTLILGTVTTPVIAVLKIKAPGGPNGIETVVITADNIPHRPPFILQFTLGRNSELTIESETVTGQVRLVKLSPALFGLISDTDSQNQRCQALLGDGTRCRLQSTRADRRWCGRHQEQHCLLHDEMLKELKPINVMNTTNANITTLYNLIQRMIALRVIITEVLYAGDEDEGHAEAVSILRRNRGVLGQRMVYSEPKVDTTARKPVKHYISQFLHEAEQREMVFCPRVRLDWQSRQTINLRQVRSMLAMLQMAPWNSSKLSEIFCPAGSSQLLDYIEEIVDSRRIVDLPELPEKVTFTEQSSVPTDEELLAAMNQPFVPLTKEEEEALDTGEPWDALREESWFY